MHGCVATRGQKHKRARLGKLIRPSARRSERADDAGGVSGGTCLRKFVWGAHGDWRGGTDTHPETPPAVSRASPRVMSAVVAFH